MRAVIQRVSTASVAVPDQTIAEIGPGLTVLLGVTHTDTQQTAAQLATKIFRLRILDDEQSCEQTGAPLLVVSQFTIYGDARKGRRPSWTAAAPGDLAEPMYEHFCAELEQLGAEVKRGVFGAQMQVHLVNDGPFTMILET